MATQTNAEGTMIKTEAPVRSTLLSPETPRYDLTKVLVPAGPLGMYQEVQRFSDAKIQEAMLAATTAIGERKGYIFRLGADATGANAALAVRLNGHLSVVTAFHHDWKGGDWAAGLEVAGFWD